MAPAWWSIRWPIQWRTTGWRGRPWTEAVLYELHVGTFSDSGDFAGVQRKLDWLAELGVTAIELMPVADFAGWRNWGYDGVLPFAPARPYGTPDQLKALIDAAHERGLMMFLDVVYNHFGPEGNYLGQYAPQFFTDRHHTPWGAAIDFTAAGRARLLHPQRALLAERVPLRRAAPGRRPRDPRRQPDAHPDRAGGSRASGVRRRIATSIWSSRTTPTRRASSARQRYDAQWNDDFHHASHVVLTRESEGYYVDYQRDPLAGAWPRSGGGLRLPGRSLRSPRWRTARRADAGPAALGLRRFPAEPRPDRQPRVRRAAGASWSGRNC